MSQNKNRRGFLGSLQKTLFQTYNKASAILGSPFLASNTANLLMKEREKIKQGNRDRGFRFPMKTAIYEPKLDKSGIKNKPKRGAVSMIPTGKKIVIKLGKPKPKKKKP